MTSLDEAPSDLEESKLWAYLPKATGNQLEKLTWRMVWLSSGELLGRQSALVPTSNFSWALLRTGHWTKQGTGTILSNVHNHRRRSGLVLFHFIGKETEVQGQSNLPKFPEMVSGKDLECKCTSLMLFCETRLAGEELQPYNLGI